MFTLTVATHFNRMRGYRTLRRGVCLRIRSRVSVLINAGGTKSRGRYPQSTILVIQLIGSDGEEMAAHLDDQLMDETAETRFRESWIADYSLMAPYDTIQLIGIKPKRALH
jgi:hypothetical protein